jgi:hypothetical protein
VLVPDAPDEKEEGLVRGTRRYLDERFVQPQSLSLDEVDPVFGPVAAALGLIELEKYLCLSGSNRYKKYTKNG